MRDWDNNKEDEFRKEEKDGHDKYYSWKVTNYDGQSCVAGVDTADTPLGSNALNV